MISHQWTVGFPIYELVVPDLTPRWLSIFDGEGEQGVVVSLAFGWIDDRGDRWVDLTTALKPDAPPAGWSREDWDWYDGGLSALTRNDIDYQSPAAQPWRAAAEAFNEDYETHYKSWSVPTWTVDGQPLVARSFEIDGDWAALCVTPDDVVIFAWGQGVEPANLVMQRSDGAGYGVDFREPLYFPDSVRTSRAFARRG